MAFQTPEFSKKQVQRAGDTLRAVPANAAAIVEAMPIITNWRAAHAYPLNTFQATLRRKLRKLGIDKPIVGQRLKRLPSIAGKLRRFPAMNLDRMQDIAGLRAVVPTMARLRLLRSEYEQHSRFLHELRNVHDYVTNPKADGYRSIHLIYRYYNETAPQYDGLHVELQLRTQLQHAWATAVETVDAFANQAIKAGRPEKRWAEFFQLASAAFALQEKSPVPEAYQDLPERDVREQLIDAESKLNVLLRLRGFSVAADKIHRSGRSSAAYHIVVLDRTRRTLRITSFPGDQLEHATDAYAAAELRAAAGEPIDAVMVAGGSVDQLRKSYPNYFLDANVFLSKLGDICGKRAAPSGARPLRR